MHGNGVDGFYAWRAVAILNLAYILSYLDRQILTLLIDPIKSDLSLSDTQMGVLSGLAFVLCHTVALVPIGQLSDRLSRKRIICSGILTWSAFTAGCGLASSYVSLFVARMGVGLGEAALVPPVYSLIADSFTRRNLQRAMSFFVVGAPVGSGLALVAGGGLIEFFTAFAPSEMCALSGLRPWQMVFIAVGALGIPVLLLMALVREPARKEMLTNDRGDAVSIRFVDCLDFIRSRNRLFVLMTGGVALVNITAYGALTWLPTFFIRHHGWSAADAGLRIGAISLVFGVAGPVVAAMLTTALERRGDKAAAIKTLTIGMFLMCPFFIAAPLFSSAWLSLLILAPAFLGLYITGGVLPTLIPLISPNQMRARLSALFIMVVNLLGLGLGPASVGFVTDRVFGDAGSLGSSMTMTFAITMTAGCLLTIMSWRPFLLARQQAASWEIS